MKQTDPDNMRIPALRLLIDLLPTGSRAGIWTFGRYANMQVPLNPVTPAWRNRAIEQAGQIYSRGSFTNIEAGIKRSTLDWTKPSPLHDRHVILLTDGVIALPRGQEASAQSRANLLGAELERLRAVGAAIHTIGLSQLANTQLLTRLSALSGGHYIEADSADLLRHAFLRVLEHVAGLNNLPLVGARFRVDKDIDAIALLIVRGSPESPAPELRTPAGRIVSAAMAQGLDVPVRWETQGGYHVVTITSPVVGTWEVHTTEDPDNRVIGRSGIRLRASQIPEFVLPGGEISVTAQLSDEGSGLLSREHLSGMTFSARLARVEKLGSVNLLDDGKSPDAVAGDGRYTGTVVLAHMPGRMEIVIRAQGPALSRE